MMWIVNQDGYFSIVEKDGAKARPLCVRSRVKIDLVRLLERIGVQRQIAEGVGTDYRYRTWLSRDGLISYMSAIIGSLTYSNFKSSLEAAGADQARLATYHGIWAESMDLRFVGVGV